MTLLTEDIDDQALLQHLAEGSQEAFDRIYLRYRRPLVEAAYKRLGDRQQAEDLVQDVFFSLWDKKESRQIDNLPAYLHQAIRNRVFTLATRNKQIRLFQEPLQHWLIEKDSPDNQLIKKELWACIHAYANTLPRKRQQIFLLYMSSRLSTNEIATQLNISVKTVQNQLGTAIDGLYELVTPSTSLVILAALLPLLER